MASLYMYIKDTLQQLVIGINKCTKLPLHVNEKSSFKTLLHVHAAIKRYPNRSYITYMYMYIVITFDLAYSDSSSVVVTKALPDPVGSIPMGTLMALSQSPRSIRPFTTYMCTCGIGGLNSLDR